MRWVFFAERLSGPGFRVMAMMTAYPFYIDPDLTSQKF